MNEICSLHTCATEKPELYQPVRLYFEDELESAGQWTGRVWWSHGHEVAPMWWQYAAMEGAERAIELHHFRN